MAADEQCLNLCTCLPTMTEAGREHTTQCVKTGSPGRATHCATEADIINDILNKGKEQTQVGSRQKPMLKKLSRVQCQMPNFLMPVFDGQSFL